MKELESNPVASTSLIGKKVDNNRGERIGQIKDLLFSPVDRKITSIILTTGFSLNPVEQYVVIPFKLFKSRTEDGRKMIVNIDQNILETAPKLDSIASHQAVSENLFVNKFGCFAIDDMQLRHLQLNGYLNGMWGDSAPEGSMNTSNAYSSNPDHKDSDAHRGPFPIKDMEGNMMEDGSKDRPMP